MEKERVLENVIRYLEHKDLINNEPFMKGDSEVPVSGGKLSYFDIINIVDAALDGWMTEGKWAERFRRELSEYTGSKHVVLCNSGSSANLLALSAIKEKYNINNNDIVITSALAFPTTVAPIIQVGLIPCFVDINIETLNPYPEVIENAIKSKKAKGVILAHTLGFPYDIEYIKSLCHLHGCFLIQDMCDALGAKTNEGTQLGEFGDISTLSFFPAHQINTGEGGAVLTNNGQLFNIVRSLANWGRDCWCKPGDDNTCGKRFEQKFNMLPEGYDHKYITSRVGYNMKMTELQAALGTSQMSKIKKIVYLRRLNYTYLKTNLKAISKFNEIFTLFRNPILSSPFGFPIMVKFQSGTTRNQVVSFLEARKIRTRPIFSGNITKQPMMEHIPYDQLGDLHNCDRIMEDAFWIGCGDQLSQEQLDYVIESFTDFLGRLL
jgi:CDP-6-deoxy-D-xylo-4-hexulose-3-dehydrase